MIYMSPSGAQPYRPGPVTSVRAFRIDVPDEVLDDLQARLSRSRLPVAIPGLGWNQGIDHDLLRTVLEHWQEGYDWRAQERRLNTWEHVLGTFDGQPIHAIHARSPHADALPLLLVHGWPSSVVEFLEVLPLLTDPPDDSQPFHVVVPSLPGFAWSGPTTTTGWHPRRIAAAFAELLTELGYSRFGAQGGDWGRLIVQNLADLHPERVVGIHLNACTVRRPTDAPPLTAEEQAALDAMRVWRQTGSGYQAIQSTKPQTLGIGLEDSPIALAAWIIEKFHAWSDLDRLSLDQLLTNVMAYWVTGTATSAMRIYWDMRVAGAAALPQARVEVPTGVAHWPGEITRFPRSWIEHRYALIRLSEPAAGGHFPAMEVPQLFADELRSFFAQVPAVT